MRLALFWGGSSLREEELFITLMQANWLNGIETISCCEVIVTKTIFDQPVCERRNERGARALLKERQRQRGDLST